MPEACEHLLNFISNLSPIEIYAKDKPETEIAASCLKCGVEIVFEGDGAWRVTS